MARHAGPAGADLLHEVERLAGEGLRRAEIAQRLGFRNSTTLVGRLVKASQLTGKPIPAFGVRAKGTLRKEVEAVQVKPRGRGGALGVSVPQEPLERLGARPGDKLAVTVGRRRIVLAVERGDKSAEAGPRQPRLVKGRRTAT